MYVTRKEGPPTVAEECDWVGLSDALAGAYQDLDRLITVVRRHLEFALGFLDGRNGLDQPDRILRAYKEVVSAHDALERNPQ